VTEEMFQNGSIEQIRKRLILLTWPH